MTDTQIQSTRYIYTVCLHLCVKEENSRAWIQVLQFECSLNVSFFICKIKVIFLCRSNAMMKMMCELQIAIKCHIIILL